MQHHSLHPGFQGRAWCRTLWSCWEEQIKGWNDVLEATAWPYCSPACSRQGSETIHWGSVCSQVWVSLFTLGSMWWAEGHLRTLLAIWLTLCTGEIISNFRVAWSLELFLGLPPFAWPELFKGSATAQVDSVRSQGNRPWEIDLKSIILLQQRRKNMCYECPVRAGALLWSCILSWSNQIAGLRGRVVDSYAVASVLSCS